MGSIQTPLTTTVTNHGLLIKANGNIIGAITEWNPAHDRDVTAVYEFGQQTIGQKDHGPAGMGEPYENVPGNVRNMKISVQRYDLYTAHLESAFGKLGQQDYLEMLSRQTDPFQLQEFWSSPDGTTDFTYTYFGCWFTNVGRTHSASGDRIVKVAASLQYTRRRKL